MISASPPPHLSFSFHNDNLTLHNRTIRSLNINNNNKTKNPLGSFTPPCSSLLSAPTISTHENAPKQPFPLQHLRNLCNTGNLNEAFNFLQSNLNDVVSPSNIKSQKAIAIILQACGRHKNIELARRVHAFVSTSSVFRNDVVLITRILTMYSNCGFPSDSRFVFDESRKNNLVLWNALLSAYSSNELFRDAVLLFVELISSTEFLPDNFTLPCVIKACAGLSDVKLGEAIHAFALKTKLFSDVFVGNAFVAMYGKFGFVDSALKVFDRMPERNLVSWNSIKHSYSTPTISTHENAPKQPFQHFHNLCNTGNLNQAFNFLQSNLNDIISSSNLKPQETIAIILQACGRHKNIKLARRLHTFVSASSVFRNDIVLITSILTMYSNCGFPYDSRYVFDALRRKNLVLWNALLSAYSRNELFRDAVLLFVELISLTEFLPDNFTLPCVIKACAGLSDVKLGEVIHAFALKTKLFSDVFVGNAFVAMYGKFGFVESALKVFDRMPERNLVSWNSIMHAYSENGVFEESCGLFKRFMIGDEGLAPDVATMVTMIPLCAAQGEVELGMLLHGLALKLGLVGELKVNNSLMDMYSKCGYLCEARVLFDFNKEKSVISWNSMIGGYSKEGDFRRTFELLRNMQMEEKVRVDEVTLLNVLPVCVEEIQFLKLKEIHGYSLRHGFLRSDELVANALVAGYAKCGSLDYAEGVFAGMELKTVSSWNAVIGGHAQNGFPGKALDLYLLMRDSGLDPDCFTIGSLLLACARLKSLSYGKEIHGFMIRNGFELDEFIGISIVSLYVQCGKMLQAKLFFDDMEEKSLVCWNTVITGSSQNKLPCDALDMFRQMLSSKVWPDEISIMGALGACSQVSALRLGKELHCFAMKAHLTRDNFVTCSLIDMYAKCGCIEQSQNIFDSVNQKDNVLWNVLIAGYGINGHGPKAIELFKSMQSAGCRPDSITFIGLLTACNHAGLVAEGLEYLAQMQSLFGIKPKLEHYACVVDMLGRAGRLNEAMKLVNELPDKPDSGIWISLLSSCRNYGDLDIGEEVAKKLLELGPGKPKNYVLISNLYARLGKWDEVRKVRQRMKDIGLQKDAGCSWIEIGGKVYRFLAGDESLLE